MNKNDLATAIYNSFNKGPTTDPEVAKRQAQEAAREIANAIDAYFQSELGERLSLVKKSVLGINLDGFPQELTEGPEYRNFTRKK